MTITIKQKKGVRYTFPLFTVAIILMVIGFILDNATEFDKYGNLGEVLFSIGFWLLMIPLIIIGIILGIIFILLVITS